jgi:hypothetical protein
VPFQNFDEYRPDHFSRRLQQTPVSSLTATGTRRTIFR